LDQRQLLLKEANFVQFHTNFSSISDNILYWDNSPESSYFQLRKGKITTFQLQLYVIGGIQSLIRLWYD